MTSIYSDIIDYVSKTDAEIYEIIETACAKFLLSQTKGKAGITFLMPHKNNTLFRTMLMKLASSIDIDDHKTLHDHIAAMTLQSAYKSLDDWKKSPINSLNPPQILYVSNVSNNKVSLQCGASLVLNTDFSCKKSMCIWYVESGIIPVTTDKSAPMVGNKIGAYDEKYDDMSLRNKICIAIENKYALQRISKGLNDNKNDLDVFIHATLSIVNFVVNVKKDLITFREKLIPLISLNAVDIYFIIEPHRVTGDFLLPDSIISEWWKQNNIYSGFDPKNIIDLIQTELCSQNCKCALYTDRCKLLEEIHKVRKESLQSIRSSPRSIVDHIEKCYKELESNNTIGSITNALPPSLFEHYKNNLGLKLLQDQLRFYVYMELSILEKSIFDIQIFNDLLNYIGECLRAQTETERSKSLRVLDKNALKYMIATDEYIQNINIFINSTMFLFVPVTYDEAKSIKQKYSTGVPSINTTSMLNTNVGQYDKHLRVVNLQSSQLNEDLLKMLANLDLSKVDNQMRELILSKLNK